MASLRIIVNCIEKQLNIKINVDCLLDTDTKYIRFLTKKELDVEDLPTDVLYLVDYNNDELRNIPGSILYVNCPLNMLTNAMCTNESNIFSIYNVAEKILERFQGEEEKKKRLFTLIHETDSLKDILEDAYQVLGVPITIVNSGYTVIGKIPLEGEELYDRKKRKYPINNEFIERMKNDGIEQRLIDSNYPFEILLPILNYHCVFCSIKIKQSVVAYIYIPCSKRRLTKPEMEYVYVLSLALSVQLQKNYSYQNPKFVQVNAFYRDLLDGNIKTPEDIPYSSLGINFKPCKYYYFMCWCFKTKEVSPWALNFQLYEISQILENSITCIQNNYLISLIATDNYSEYLKIHKPKIESFLTMNKMISSISFSFNNLEMAGLYCNQALFTLEHHLFNNTTKLIHHYKDYYLLHLMRIIKEKPQIAATINYKIKEMILYDKSNNTNYTDTLIAYIKNNRNAPQTAEALFIHKSTLFYRFNKMKEMFRIYLDNYEECFSYEFSLRILELM